MSNAKVLIDWKELGRPFDKVDDIPREHMVVAIKIAGLLGKCAVCDSYMLKAMSINKVCSECACK